MLENLIKMACWALAASSSKQILVEGWEGAFGNLAGVSKWCEEPKLGEVGEQVLFAT